MELENSPAWLAGATKAETAATQSARAKRIRAMVSILLSCDFTDDEHDDGFEIASNGAIFAYPSTSTCVIVPIFRFKRSSVRLSSDRTYQSGHE